MKETYQWRNKRWPVSREKSAEKDPLRVNWSIGEQNDSWNQQGPGEKKGESDDGDKECTHKMKTKSKTLVPG